MEILYEDAAIAVCRKPAGVLSQAADGKKGEDMPTLLAAAAAVRGEAATYYTVHRLDRATAGVMVYAKTSRAAATLSGREMQKTYWAVVEGVPSPAAGEMQDFLYFDRQKDKTYVVKKERRGVKPAHLSYKTLACTVGEDGTPLALVEVTLHTGRTHQIRAQFAARRLPLCGDPRYGAKTKSPLALLAHTLTFRHPESGEEMTFSTPPDNPIFSRFL